MEDRNVEIRAALDEVAKDVPPSLTQLVIEQNLQFSGRTMTQLLGPGSEAILPADDRIMKPERVAAALQLWARRRLRRSQTRSKLVDWAKRVSAVTRRLKQRLAGAKLPAELPEQRLVYYMGTTRLRFRVRNFLWAHGSPNPRIFDQALHSIAPQTNSDRELARARVRAASRLSGRATLRHLLPARRVSSRRRSRAFSRSVRKRHWSWLIRP